MSPQPRVRLGISACLLGEPVRFDGGHKHQRELVESLAPFCDFVPVCPELEAGFGVPRQAIRLVGAAGEPARARGSRDGEDVTAALGAASEGLLAALAERPLDGFILKKDSPSCGHFRVRLYPEAPGAPPSRQGRGLFAAALAERFPRLPIEEEGRLNDPALRRAFFERIFARRRLRQALEGPDLSAGDLVRFHSQEKLLVLSHDPDRYRRLGKIVARLAERPLPQVLADYRRGFEDGLATPTTRGRQVNVLQHILGYLRRHLPQSERDHLRQVIADYAANKLPRAVPLNLLEHRCRGLAIDYLLRQSYFRPHPLIVERRGVA